MLVAIYAPTLKGSYEEVRAARKLNVPFLKDPAETGLSKADCRQMVSQNAINVTIVAASSSALGANRCPCLALE